MVNAGVRYQISVIRYQEPQGKRKRKPDGLKRPPLQPKRGVPASEGGRYKKRVLAELKLSA
jgi:hypothetical protein